MVGIVSHNLCQYYFNRNMCNDNSAVVYNHMAIMQLYGVVLVQNWHSLLVVEIVGIVLVNFTDLAVMAIAILTTLNVLLLFSVAVSGGSKQALTCQHLTNPNFNFAQAPA